MKCTQNRRMELHTEHKKTYSCRPELHVKMLGILGYCRFGKHSWLHCVLTQNTIKQPMITGENGGYTKNAREKNQNINICSLTTIDKWNAIIRNILRFPHHPGSSSGTGWTLTCPPKASRLLFMQCQYYVEILFSGHPAAIVVSYFLQTMMIYIRTLWSSTAA